MVRITSIETFRRDEWTALVRVRTDDGAEGWGQTSPYLADLSVPVLHRLVAPFVLGRNPWDWETSVAEFARRSHKWHGSLLWRALCGVDTAVWDLLARTVGVPVFRLLGGSARSSVPVYASSMSREISPEAEADRLAGVIEEQGFRAAKIKIAEMMGRDTDPWPRRSHDLVSTVRERLGPGVVLHADANGGYSVTEAVRMGRRLEELGFSHFEEPCPWNELESTAEVTRTLDIAVAGGEQDQSLEQFHRMVGTRTVDIVQPDIGYVGGLSRARKVTQMAEAAGLVATPHCANRSLLQVFTLHLAASQPSVSAFQEWSIEQDRWSEDLYDPVPEVRDGAVVLGDRPGWGVEIDPGYLAAAEHLVSR